MSNTDRVSFLAYSTMVMQYFMFGSAHSFASEALTRARQFGSKSVVHWTHFRPSVGETAVNKTSVNETLYILMPRRYLMMSGVPMAIMMTSSNKCEGETEAEESNDDDVRRDGGGFRLLPAAAEAEADKERIHSKHSTGRRTEKMNKKNLILDNIYNDDDDDDEED